MSDFQVVRVRKLPIVHKGKPRRMFETGSLETILVDTMKGLSLLFGMQIQFWYLVLARQRSNSKIGLSMKTSEIVSWGLKPWTRWRIARSQRKFENISKPRTSYKLMKTTCRYKPQYCGRYFIAGEWTNLIINLAAGLPRRRYSLKELISYPLRWLSWKMGEALIPEAFLLRWYQTCFSNGFDGKAATLRKPCQADSQTDSQTFTTM